MSQTTKRLLDFILATAGLIALSPLFLLVAIIIRLTSQGPILFRQLRLGRDGEPFSVVKFRTMNDNAPDIRNPDGSAFTPDHDPRVTAAGQWLRRTSLDELPQLWNILQGDMSLVGPRPDQVDQVSFYSPHDRIRLTVRPGLTGLAQISGRNRITWAERRKLDATYVRNWSLWLDLKILALTIPYVLAGKDTANELHTDEPPPAP